MERIRVPGYFTSFKCIADRCEDHCCYGWRVYIDRDKYDKYQSAVVRINGFLLSEIVQMLPEDQRTPTAYGFVNMKNGVCPLFTEERLCAMHRDLGPEYLSTVCASYPRLLWSASGRQEIFFSLSCPEICRLALLNPDPAQFIEIPEIDLPYLDLSHIDADIAPGIGLFFESVRLNAIRLLQRRSLTVLERLILFGMFTKRIEEALEQNRPADIADIVGRYGSRLNEADVKRQIASIHIDPKLPTAISLELVTISRIEGFKATRFQEAVQILAKILGVEKELSINDATNRYVSIKAAFKQQIDMNLFYVWENFLVHRVSQWAHVLAAGGSPFRAYLETVVLYTIVRLLFFGQAAHRGDVTPEKAVEIIQIVSKAVEHSPECLKTIHTFFTDNNLDNMGNCAALLSA